jgi:hypothetical protein
MRHRLLFDIFRGVFSRACASEWSLDISVAKRGEITGEWSHLHNLYSSPNKITKIRKALRKAVP